MINTAGRSTTFPVRTAASDTAAEGSIIVHCLYRIPEGFSLYMGIYDLAPVQAMLVESWKINLLREAVVFV